MTGHCANNIEGSAMSASNATRWGAGLHKKIDLSGEWIHNPYTLPHCCRNQKEALTPIQELFHGTNVLVTGGTGFMGKLLIEKLLASCPSINKIYVIIRDRKDKRADLRLEELMNSSVFTRVRQTVPDYKRKVIPVNGDVSMVNLGLDTAEYKKLLEIIHVIFHGAATVRFIEKLSDSARINLAGTREIVRFSKQCKNLRSLVHVSTAYANGHDHELVLEKFYAAKRSYREILELLDNNPELLNRLEKEIVPPAPNTYCCTKKLAEDLIAEEAVGLPICVFRPGIVILSYQEPTPGWTDTVAGPTAGVVGTVLGVLRVSPVDPDMPANFVPVDLAINAMIAAAWKNADKPRMAKKDIPIYNYTSEGRNPMTWREFTYWNVVYGSNWATPLLVWYPCILFVTNPIAFSICSFFLHTVPSYVIDAALWISRRKPIMINATKKMMNLLDVMTYFLQRNISFSDVNTLSLWKCLDPMDQAIYPFDIADLDWDQLIQVNLLGVRVHILKDPLETLDRGRRKLKFLYILHKCLQAAAVAVLIWIFMQVLIF